MNNTDETFRKNPTIGCRASSILSVALMLFLFDLMLSAVAVTNGAGDNMRRQVGFVLKTHRDAGPADISELELVLGAMPGVDAVSHTTADVVLEEERVFNPELLSLMGYNPFSDEFDVTVKPDYANTDSLAKLVGRMTALPNVEDVYMQPDMADNVNELLSRINIYITVFVFVLALISFALIFNTMKLAVYSRRFTIHNMRIVGATRLFILRPFLKGGLLTGLLSAIIAYALFGALVYYSYRFDYNIFFTVSMAQYIMIFVASLLVGVLLCVGTSYFTVMKYMDSPYEELFS